MTRPLPANPGDIIGHYRLEALIGRGSMGAVYRAVHIAREQVAVALKVMDAQYQGRPGFVRRFVHEAQIAQSLHHPNIVQVFEFFGGEGERLACVMELIQGPTLAKSVRGDPLSLTECVGVLSQVISAVRLIHEKGVIHRDLKPSNVLFTAPREVALSRKISVKIVDFGIAKMLDGSHGHTEPGAILGTPRYLAPEQIDGSDISSATDVYALGELLYEMASGRRAFPENRDEVLRIKLYGGRPELLPPPFPEASAFLDIVYACLAPASDRPTLDELESSLAELERSQDVTFEPGIEHEDDLQLDPEPRVIPVHDAVGANVRTKLRPRPIPSARAEAGVARLGRYSILEDLGVRGMTQSYLARRDGQLEICRLKRLLQSLANNETAVARFRREALLAAHLQHPNITRTLESGLEGETFCIAQELVLGVTLEQLLEALTHLGRPMPLQVFATIAFAVLDGLEHAHNARDARGLPLPIVHRDLAPRNVVVSFGGEIKIADFGVAKATVDDFRTAPGYTVGTVEYLSPEQVLSLEVDERSDIYSASAVFFEMLAGRSLIPSGEVIETLKRITRDQPPSLRTLRSDLSEEFESTVARGLEKDKTRRWRSIGEYKAALRAALGGFDDPGPDWIGDFVRNVLPDEEQKAIDLMARIRRLGASIPNPVPREDSAFTTLRPRVMPVPEPELSGVFTMPGQSIRLKRSRVRPLFGLKGRLRVAALLVVASSVLLGVIVLVLANGPEGEVHGLIAPEAPTPSVQVSARSQEEASGAEAKAVAAAPAPAPAPAKAPAAVAPVLPLESSAVSTESDDGKREDRATQKRAKTAPRGAAGPDKFSAKAPPDLSVAKAGLNPKSETAPSAKSEKPHAELWRDLQELRSASADQARFDALFTRIKKAAESSPAEVRRRAKIHLDAAERTYDVALLQKALVELSRSSTNP